MMGVLVRVALWVVVLVLGLLVPALVPFRLSFLMRSRPMRLMQARHPYRRHGYCPHNAPTTSCHHLARSHGLVRRSSDDIQDLLVRGT